MTLFTILLSATGVSLVILLVSLWWYIRARQQAPETAEAENEISTEAQASAEKGLLEASQEVSQKQLWIELIDQQIELCEQLSTEQKALGEDDLALRCWKTFLDIERILLVADEYDVAPYLEQFEFVLERLKQAQEIDALLKQLSVSNSLLKELNKVVQKTGEAVFAQMNITANLNLKLDSLQTKLQDEAALDKELAELRLELAAMYEFAERLRASIKSNAVAQDDDYLSMLEDFLGSAPTDAFLAPMKTELDEKVEELQHLASYRSQVIDELKGRLKQQKGTSSGHIADYDIAFARMEKSLMESNKVIKALEHKLETLQTIKYNLNVDVRKREEVLRLKDQKLKESSLSNATLNAQEAIAREQSAVDTLAGMLDAAPLNGNLSEFEESQAEKLTKLQQLISESELYVSVLERDLDKEKLEHEQLLERLESKNEISDSGLSGQEHEELENLKEINAELENEKRSLEAQISSSGQGGQDVEELQQKIIELDAKIETVQANYVNMEERYLNSLMS